LSLKNNWCVTLNFRSQNLNLHMKCKAYIYGLNNMAWIWNFISLISIQFAYVSYFNQSRTFSKSDKTVTCGVQGSFGIHFPFRPQTVRSSKLELLLNVMHMQIVSNSTKKIIFSHLKIEFENLTTVLSAYIYALHFIWHKV